MTQSKLAGKQILITRPQLQAEIFVAKLEQFGARTALMPSIEIKPSPDPRPLQQAVQQLTRYDGIIFASLNGAKYFLDEVETQQEKEQLQENDLIAIGSVTESYLNGRGVDVDMVPEVFTSKQMLSKLRSGKRYLMPQGNRSSMSQLNALGDVKIDRVLAYFNTFREISEVEKEQLEQTQFDFVTFTSASCAAGVLAWFAPALLPDALVKIPAICIGPSTAEAAHEAGFETLWVAQEHTTDGMIDCMLERVNDES